MVRERRSGFTLIELIVVMSLVLLLSGVASVYNRAVGRQIVVAREHAKVLALFVRARSAGLTIPKVDRAVELVCAYGVHVDPASRTVTLFKDQGVVGETCASANSRYDGDSELIDRAVLEPVVTLTAVNIADVVFVPPSGDVVITDADGASHQSAMVTVTDADADISRSVGVNVFGQITEFEPES